MNKQCVDATTSRPALKTVCCSKLLTIRLSGVARVPCALGQEMFLRPRQQKLRSLK